MGMDWGSESGHSFRSSDDCYFEKRRVFLSSYQFRRKESVTEKIKASFVRVTKRIIILFRFRLKKKFCVRLRYRYNGSRRRFQRLVVHGNQGSSSSFYW
ncbi:hypothetical protein ACHQM5_010270 [Ranunculus cassubicifolius]